MPTLTNTDPHETILPALPDIHPTIVALVSIAAVPLQTHPPPLPRNLVIPPHVLHPLITPHNTTILAGIDCYSRFIELAPTKGTESYEYARFYAYQVFPRHGAYFYVLTDRGEQFSSRIGQDLARIFQAELRMSATGHPQFGAIVERSNRGTVDILRKYALDHPLVWDINLPFLMLSLNTCVQGPIQEVPFFLQSGADANLPLQTIFGNPLPNPQANSDAYLRDMIAQLQSAFRTV